MTSLRSALFSRLSKKQPRDDKSGRHDLHLSDYVFAFEDESLRAEAKAALSFATPYADSMSENLDSCKSDTRFLTNSGTAFEFTGNTLWNSETDTSAQYHTIFTYSELPVSNDVAIDYESPVGRQSGWNKSSTAYLLYGLSALLLIIFFPILGWIFVKRLSENERLIVFRLGKRLKIKGPGFVCLLPFCDRGRTIRLDEQTMEIGPVSGGTVDEALAEVRLSVSYRLTDPDCVYMTVKEAPNKLVSTQAQLCVLSALSRLSWMHLSDGGAKHDLATNTIVSLNFRCGSHGIQVSNVEILDVRLVRAAPSPETVKKRRTSTLQKQFQALSSAFLHKSPIEAVKKTEIIESLQAPSDAPVDGPENNVAADTISQIGDGGPANVTGDFGPATSKSFREDVCKRALARARPFLSNQLVCTALGHTTMQLIVSGFACSEPIPDLLDASKNDDLTLIYLDSKHRCADFGVLPSGTSPDVTFYLSASDLLDVLSGRLKIPEAMRNRMFLTGNTTVFKKLSYLLQFQI